MIAPVILFNVVEGISLHEGETNNGGNDGPRCQIDHDLRWSAIQAHQIDGRSHRDGKFAQVYWVVAKDTIDSRVGEVLLWKLESMGNLQGDSTKDFEEILSAIQKKRAHEGWPRLKSPGPCANFALLTRVLIAEQPIVLRPAPKN
jgi:hypothetical protein